MPNAIGNQHYQSKPAAWVTGAGGLIGKYLLQIAAKEAPNWNVRGWRRAALDLLDRDAVRKRFADEKPALVIHCAALSLSPQCQALPDLAWRMNYDATVFLADLASDIPFLFFSTDLVFDGSQGNYREEDEVRPLGVYAETKAAAEKRVLQNPQHTVIRTSLNGGTSPKGDRGFNEQLRKQWKAGTVARLFTDEFRSPIPAEVTARITWALARHPSRAGIYHVAGSERLSRWQIGQLIAERWPELHPRLEAASLREYEGAPRAPDTSLDCARVQGLLGCRLPGLTEWLGSHPNAIF